MCGSKNAFHLDQVVTCYCLEDVLEGLELTEGVLRHAIMTPVFLKAAPFFLRQVMRLADVDSLVYCLKPADVMVKLFLEHVTFKHITRKCINVSNVSH